MPATDSDLLTRHRRATYADVLDAPRHKVAEIVDGVLYMHSRPAFRHANASSILGSIILPPFHRGIGGPGGWLILDEPELHLGKRVEDILVPDIAGWRREGFAEGAEIAYFSTVPDWVCEVLSPSTRKFDLESKSDVYAREGVSYLWLVDPISRTLEAFALRNGRWKRIANLRGDAIVSISPFQAISFPLSELWLDDFPTSDAGEGSD